MSFAKNSCTHERTIMLRPECLSLQLCVGCLRSHALPISIALVQTKTAKPLCLCGCSWIFRHSVIGVGPSLTNLSCTDQLSQPCCNNPSCESTLTKQKQLSTAEVRHPSKLNFSEPIRCPILLCFDSPELVACRSLCTQRHTLPAPGSDSAPLERHGLLQSAEKRQGQSVKITHAKYYLHIDVIALSNLRHATQLPQDHDGVCLNMYLLIELRKCKKLAQQYVGMPS